jgi:hypothetical protein
MHLVQVLLPLYNPQGDPFGGDLFAAVRLQLTERFGGVTAYARAPAKGLWKDADGEVARDDIVVYEVMTDELDTGWWSGYRERLRMRFEQEDLVIRALPAVRL